MNDKWVCDEEKTIVRYPLIELIEKHCHSLQTQKKIRFVTLKTGDWCNVIPLTKDGKIVMVKQYRVGIDDYTLELPGGVIDASDKDHESAALRELKEETGYTPVAGAKCISLGWSFPNPAIMNNRCHSVIVGPVAKSSNQNLDPGEMIDVLEIPLEDIPEKIIQGEIRHALMLTNFFFLFMRSNPEASASFLRGLRDFTRV
jgi:ADP-ribose pyrophosphatase